MKQLALMATTGVLLATAFLGHGHGPVLVVAATQEVSTEGEALAGTPSPEPPAPAAGAAIPAQWLGPPQPPDGGFTVLIGHGAPETSSRFVSLTLRGGPDAARMVIANTPELTGSGSTGQIPYQSEYSWDICRGRTSCPGGVYTVYVKWLAPWGAASEVASASIIYRERAPQWLFEQIAAKVKDIARLIADLGDQVAQSPEKEEIAAEAPEGPPEAAVPPAEDARGEQRVPPAEEGPPEKEGARLPGLLREFGNWLWRRAAELWQRLSERCQRLWPL